MLPCKFVAFNVLHSPIRFGKSGTIWENLAFYKDKPILFFLTQDFTGEPSGLYERVLP